MSRPSEAKLVLSIAGLKVAVSSGDSTLVDRLHKRYLNFAGEGRPHLTLRLDWLECNQQPPFERGLERQSVCAGLEAGLESTLRQGERVFCLPGYEGYFDLAGGQAALSLASLHPIEDIEYYLRFLYAFLAFDAGGVMFHSAGIARCGRAYLFFGHSGSGKTTVSRLSAGDTVLNDDLVVILPAQPGTGAWQVYSTPFTNPTQVSPCQAAAPLAGLFRLVQYRQVFVEPLGLGQALAEAVSNVPVIPLDAPRNERLLERLMVLLEHTPAYNLHFLPDASFWPVVEQAAGGSLGPRDDPAGCN